MDRLLDQIKKFEGYRSKPYWDHKQWSVGYGTKASGPSDHVNRSQALTRLQKRLQRDVNAVNKFAPNAPQGTRDALTSLSYNAGTGWMSRGLGKLVKAGNYDTAKRRFVQYNKASGKTNSALVSRRATEASWWGAGASPIPQSQPLQSNSHATIDPSRRMSVQVPQNIQQGMTQAGSSIARGMQEGGHTDRLKQRLGMAPQAPQAPMSYAPQNPMSTRPDLIDSNPHAPNSKAFRDPGSWTTDNAHTPPPLPGSPQSISQGRMVSASANPMQAALTKPKQPGWDWNGGDWRIKWGNGKMTGMV